MSEQNEKVCLTPDDLVDLKLLRTDLMNAGMRGGDSLLRLRQYERIRYLALVEKFLKMHDPG